MPKHEDNWSGWEEREAQHYARKRQAAHSVPDQRQARKGPDGDGEGGGAKSINDLAMKLVTDVLDDDALAHGVTLS